MAQPTNKRATRKAVASTALAVIDSSPVQTINTLELALNELKRIQETPWKTSGEFGEGFPNIKTTQNVGLGVLLRMSAAVATRADLYHKAAKRHNKATYPAFEISGFDEDSWIHDIQLRMDIDEQEGKYTKLKGFQESMKQFLSKDDQKAQLQQEIDAYLASL